MLLTIRTDFNSSHPFSMAAECWCTITGKIKTIPISRKISISIFSNIESQILLYTHPLMMKILWKNFLTLWQLPTSWLSYHVKQIQDGLQMVESRLKRYCDRAHVKFLNIHTFESPISLLSCQLNKRLREDMMFN